MCYFGSDVDAHFHFRQLTIVIRGVSSAVVVEWGTCALFPSSRVGGSVWVVSIGMRVVRREKRAKGPPPSWQRVTMATAGAASVAASSTTHLYGAIFKDERKSADATPERSLRKGKF